MHRISLFKRFSYNGVVNNDKLKNCCAQSFMDTFVLVIVSNGYKFIVLLQRIRENKRKKTWYFTKLFPVCRFWIGSCPEIYQNRFIVELQRREYVIQVRKTRTNETNIKVIFFGFLSFDSGFLALFHFFLWYLYFSGLKVFYFWQNLWLFRNGFLCSMLYRLDTIKRAVIFFLPKRHVLHCSIQFKTKSNDLYLFFERRTKSVFFQFTEAGSVLWNHLSIHPYKGVRWECGTNWQWDEWNC